MLQRAQANGIRFAWLTFDEGYGCNAQFLETLSFEAPDRSGETVTIDAHAVRERLKGIYDDEDVSRFIL